MKLQININNGNFNIHGRIKKSFRKYLALGPHDIDVLVTKKRWNGQAWGWLAV